MLIHGSAEAQRRLLVAIGIVVALCAAIAMTLVVINPFNSRPPGTISVTIDSPYVGQGVAAGTAVVLHGVRVGEVTTVSNSGPANVRIEIDLDEAAAAGLTDALTVDFRPVNYFGVTGVNLVEGHSTQPLSDGAVIGVAPRGNFTLQALLSQLGEVSTGALTPQLIAVIEKTTRYADALDPFIETVMMVAHAVARIQTVSTARLLANTAGLSVAFPSAADALIGAVDNMLHNDENFNRVWSADRTEDEWQNVDIPTLEIASEGVLNDIGKLESKHLGDLVPVTDTVKALTDVMPPLLRPEGFAESLVELRTRFERLYAGTPEQRALQVRIVLDAVPGVAAPLALMGGP
ncbi:MlaD family protein [Mycobacterium sp. 1274756.6]|uniref:MlaD family protein n=1 Tax=Mycobacterium sp. 1274756.6 TaxID=1834076 RepID=UPI0008020550|nr:MlaD family protein [Mycobacterium sp. 1274756.6]OBJ70558.1 Mammalian cell entry related domain protein [Mycobacterium sp. 1274756.6]